MSELLQKKASCELECELFKTVEEKTPEYIKSKNLIDLTNKNAFSFILKKEYLYEYDEVKNPEGLNLWGWFANYEKEAKVSMFPIIIVVIIILAAFLMFRKK